jgi:hypothetical protein
VAASPFGGHPTFAEYLAWAKGQGCAIKYGISPDASRVVMIDDPTGKYWVHVVEIKETEYLVPTMVAYLDRRLHVSSPFPATDDSSYSPTP